MAVTNPAPGLVCRLLEALRPIRLTATTLVVVAVLASGCGTVSELTSSGSTSTIPDGQTTAAPSSNDGQLPEDEQASNNGTANIEVLDADDGGQPGDRAQPDVGAQGSQGAAASRYTVVAQATAPSVTARTGPDETAEPVAEFSNPTASGSPLVFRSVDVAGTASPDWIEVQLPIQPNGSTGWIPRADVTLSDNPYRVEISRANYALQVFHLNELWMETPVAIGTGDTPTPVGEFYLLELLSPPEPDGPYGPFAFGLSGFSEVLTSFAGADTAIIGLHGTNDPSSLGTDVSHGCIRLENEVIEQLAEVLPLGTPVLIT